MSADEPTRILESKGLIVRYGKRTALDRVDIRFDGGCLGLLGPNGAGKSTFLRATLGLVKPAGGSIAVLGLDAAKHGRQVRANTGYMPERECHIPGLTGLEFTTYCARLSGLSTRDARRRAHEVLAYVGLSEERYRKVDEYSRGMKQKAKLAAALVHDPSLLFLDEPTNGLDPRGRRDFLELVKDLTHEKGIHVVLSSHLLKDVEAVSDHVIVLDLGVVRAGGRIRDMLGVDGAELVAKVHGDPDVFVKAAEGRGLRVRRDARGQMVVRAGGAGDGADGLTPRTLFEVARAAGTPLREVAPVEETLEDLFLRALGPPDSPAEKAN